MPEQRFQIPVIKHTVRAAANQPGVKHHGMDVAGDLPMLPAAMQNTGIDQNTLTFRQDILIFTAADLYGPLIHHQCFQFLMPMPGDRADGKVILIAGSGKGAGTMPGQLLTTGRNINVFAG